MNLYFVFNLSLKPNKSALRAFILSLFHRKTKESKKMLQLQFFSSINIVFELYLLAHGVMIGSVFSFT